MKVSIFTKTLDFPKEEMELLWNRLNKRETFCQGQPFPYRVEFETGMIEGDFTEGELNIHHGPLLSVHGAIGDVASNYRSLYYFYGSYVLSFRLVRPTLLEFSRNEANDQLTVKLTVFIKPWFESLWNFGNGLFWSFFKRTLN